jgi:hypothetical protein
VARLRGAADRSSGAGHDDRWAPDRYTDWSSGYDPAAWLDRAIMATRTAIFPLHGLDPMP